MPAAVPITVLDLATVAPGRTIGQTLAASVELAQHAETWGYRRHWFAEHHNMPTVASSATSVLIGHVAGHTSTIRVGAGGIMLPNHAPLLIAEQFGTLEHLYPGRIDLGLGRAPGGDHAVLRALRRDPRSAESFPQDVVELRALLSDDGGTEVQAVPGAGTRVPLTILGSSLFGAQLAAALGLPYAFASHFAPDELEAALAVYRRDYRPSAEHPEPYAMVAMNVVAADTEAQAQELFAGMVLRMAVLMLRPGPDGRPFEVEALDDDQTQAVLASVAGQRARHMLRVSAVGDRDQVGATVRDIAAATGADELVVAMHSADPAARLRSYELLAEAMGMTS